MKKEEEKKKEKKTKKKHCSSCHEFFSDLTTVLFSSIYAVIF